MGLLTWPQQATAFTLHQLTVGPVRVRAYELSFYVVSVPGRGATLDLYLTRASGRLVVGKRPGTSVPPPFVQTHEFRVTRGVHVRITSNLVSGHLDANLGAYGHINLAIKVATAVHPRDCQSHNHTGMARGELQLIPGGTYFGAITRSRLPVTVSGPDIRCNARRREARSASSGHGVLTVQQAPLNAVGFAPGIWFEAYAEAGSQQYRGVGGTRGGQDRELHIYYTRPGQSVEVIDGIVVNSLPQSALTVASDLSTSTLKAAGPFLSGIANYTASGSPDATGVTHGSVSGTLTARFDTPGPLLLANPSFNASLGP